MGEATSELILSGKMHKELTLPLTLDNIAQFISFNIEHIVDRVWAKLQQHETLHPDFDCVITELGVTHVYAIAEQTLKILEKPFYHNILNIR